MNTLSFLEAIDLVSALSKRFGWDGVTKPAFKPNFTSRIYNNGDNANTFIHQTITNNETCHRCEWWVAHHEYDGSYVIVVKDIIAGKVNAHDLDKKGYDFIEAYMHALNNGVAVLNKQF
jgi:hypothetical protein